MEEIEKKLRTHPFVIPKFLQNRDLQTLIVNIVPYFKTKIPKPDRRYIELPDGSKLAVDCFWQKESKQHTSVVLLTGYEGYVDENISHLGKMMYFKAYNSGYNVIHLHQRAESDSIHLTQSIGYVLGDITIAIEQIASWGLKKIFLIGFSIGGYTMLFEIGKLGKKAKEKLLGAIAISSPTTISDSWHHIEKHPFYNWYILRFYKNLILRRAKIDVSGKWDLKQLKAIKSNHQFGETYMNMWGYAEKFISFEELNNKTDAKPLLSKIQIPTLIIHAYDDPVAPVTPFLHIANPNIITLIPKHGGHGGFFSLKRKYGDVDGLWAQNRRIEFINLLDK